MAAIVDVTVAICIHKIYLIPWYVLVFYIYQFPVAVYTASCSRVPSFVALINLALNLKHSPPVLPAHLNLPDRAHCLASFNVCIDRFTEVMEYCTYTLGKRKQVAICQPRRFNEVSNVYITVCRFKVFLETAYRYKQ